MRCLALFVSFMLFAPVSYGQTGAHKKHRSAKKPKVGSIRARSISVSFRPTCNLDSGSVGTYFFPANVGAKWTMRSIQQIFDGESHLLKSDTLYSFEQVISDSNRTLQGLPVLSCLSSLPFHRGGELTAGTRQVEYYVDDSVMMVVTNHSITSEINKIMLVNPIKIGNHWKDTQSDTVVTRIIAIHEPVSVPVGDFPNAVVVKTSTQNSEFSKYFVPNEGIVKMVYRGVPPTAKGTFVVTTELIALDRGDPAQSIRQRFSSTR